MTPAAGAGDLPEVLLSHPPVMWRQYLRAVLPRSGGQGGIGSGSGGTDGGSESRKLLRLAGVRPEAARVARYCALVGQPMSDRLPLLYPHLIGFPLQMQLMTDRTFPFSVLGLVHLSNRVSATRPLLLGDPLDVGVHTGAVRAHPRGWVVDLITVVTQDGEPVWTGSSSYLRREPGPRPDVRTDQPLGPLGPLGLSAQWRLPADLGRRYAAASGDRNPIHLYPWTARPLGFSRAVAHGMWTAAAVLAALEGRLPEALTCQVRFRRPIPLPSTVRLMTAVGPGRADAEVRGPEGDDAARLTASVVAG